MSQVPTGVGSLPGKESREIGADTSAWPAHTHGRPAPFLQLLQSDVRARNYQDIILKYEASYMFRNEFSFI
jgi:hypothetical protein